MNQLQFNGKTSTKRPNSSASSYGAETQKKARLVSQTSRLILPKPVLTEPQSQNIILQPQQQQSILSKPLQQQQQRSQLQKQQQHVFHSRHPPFQEQYAFQQQYDPQIPHLSPTLIEIDKNYDETYLVSFVIYILTVNIKYLLNFYFSLKMIKFLNLNNLMLRKKMKKTKIKILMKNLVGKIVKLRFYLIIFKKILHLGLREIKLNFIMIWQRIFCQVKRQLHKE